uniref:Centromere protein M n=2 Tax=Graphocephala atropunctata TaxID=36148 RepID=A0A1B6MBQ4_9HEMI
MNSQNSLAYDVQNPFKRLTIQIISPGEFTEPMKIALQANNKQNFQDRLHYNFCEHVDECLSWMKKNGNSPDYIAIVVDPRNKSCIELAEDNIKKLDPTFISGGRLSLVNGACSIKPRDMGVGLGHINVLAQKYSVILINGDVMIPDKCHIMATRISGLATGVCGFHTGIPVSVDVPGYDEMFQ